MKVRLFEEYNSGAREIGSDEWADISINRNMDSFSGYEISVISNILADRMRHLFSTVKYFHRKGNGYYDLRKSYNIDINYIWIDFNGEGFHIYKFEDEWFILSVSSSNYTIEPITYLCDQFYSLSNKLQEMVEVISAIKDKV